MNILYLSAQGGGLDTNVRVLAPALARAGNRVSVIYVHLTGQPVPRVDVIEGCKVYQTTVGNWHYYARRATFGLTTLPRVVRELEHERALARIIADIRKRETLDLIELPEVFATRQVVGNVPYAIRLHSAAWTWRRMLQQPSGISDSIEIWMERHTLRRANGISSPSASLAEYIRAECGLGSRQIHIIPYPVDVALFAPTRERSPLVLFVGRVEKRKGAHVLMRAIPKIWIKHPECEFVFIGRICDDVEAEVAGMSPRVRFLGAHAQAELVRWYQQASVFVAPSLWDNSPNTIYEAMACGTPVVASLVGGIPELVDDGVTGLLVKPNDADLLAYAIISLLGDEVRREQMGRRAREKALEEYSVDRILEKTLRFYEQALAGSGEASRAAGESLIQPKQPRVLPRQ